MAEVVFHDPAGNRTNQTSPDDLQPLVDGWPSAYGEQDSGDAAIQFREGGSEKALLILPNRPHGLYLKYIEGDDEWLSLEDRELLDQVVECSDEWYASIGLFLPKEKAWLARREFCLSGCCADKIDWIHLLDLSEGGNY